MTIRFIESSYVQLYSEKAWACDLNGITQRGRLMDEYENHERVARVFIHQSPSCVMPFRSEAKCLLAFISYLYMSILVITYHLTSHQFFTTCCWLCVTMVALVFWIACTRSSSTCCHLHKTSRCHAQLKNELMNGNQADHAISCEQGVEVSKDWVFVTHFINLFNTTMPMPCTDVHSETPMSQFWNRRVGMGC